MSKLIEAAKRKVSTFCKRWARADFDSAVAVAAELDGIFGQLAEAVEGWELTVAIVRECEDVEFVHDPQADPDWQWALSSADCANQWESEGPTLLDALRLAAEAKREAETREKSDGRRD